MNAKKYVSHKTSIKLHRVCAIQVMVLVPEKYSEIGIQALEDAENSIRYEIQKAKKEGGRYGR